MYLIVSYLKEICISKGKGTFIIRFPNFENARFLYIEFS